MSELPDPAGSCAPEGHCATCSDEAVPMRVVARHGGQLATCADGDGHGWEVQTNLVGEVAIGEELLVHAGVALVRLTDAGTG